jgi:hypothetical protein
MKKTLGRELVIPVGTKITEAPETIEFGEKHYEILVGIGKDHTMTIYMSEDALSEFNKYKNDIII